MHNETEHNCLKARIYYL